MDKNEPINGKGEDILAENGINIPKQPKTNQAKPNQTKQDKAFQMELVRKSFQDFKKETIEKWEENKRGLLEVDCPLLGIEKIQCFIETALEFIEKLCNIKGSMESKTLMIIISGFLGAYLKNPFMMILMEEAFIKSTKVISNLSPTEIRKIALGLKLEDPLKESEG